MQRCPRGTGEGGKIRFPAGLHRFSKEWLRKQDRLVRNAWLIRYTLHRSWPGLLKGADPWCVLHWALRWRERSCCDVHRC